MNSARWRLVSPHLDQILELSGEERQNYLHDLAKTDFTLAADLMVLLGEEQALHDEKYLEHDAQDLFADSNLVGQTFGAYVLVEPLASSTTTASATPSRAPAWLSSDCPTSPWRSRMPTASASTVPRRNPLPSSMRA